jgi:hypothetical protein
MKRILLTLSLLLFAGTAFTGINTGIGLPSAGGGGGFTLGPAQNIFTGADRTAAESARDTYQAANASWLAQYNADNSLNIRLEYTDNGNAVVQYQVRNSSDTAWADNSSSTGVKGDPGTDGVNGGIMSFESVTARDSYFNGSQTNRNLLQDGSPIAVNLGGGIVAGQYWNGRAQPTQAQYITSNWVPYTARFASGSVEFGDATVMSSLSHRVVINDRQSDIQRVPTYGVLGTAGSERPVDPGLGAIQVLIDTTANNGETSPSSLVQEFTFQTGTQLTGEATIEELAVDFASAPGTLRVQSWVGTDDTGIEVFDKVFEVSTTGVVPLAWDSESAFLPNTSYFTRATGENAFQVRGMTSDGVFTWAARSRGRFFSERGLAYQDEVRTDDQINSLIDASVPAKFRGDYSGTAIYQHGDIVRSNYEGRPAMYISAAAQQADPALPETKLETGFWFLVTDRTWRGTWSASDYVPGQVVSHSSELWMSVTLIGVGGQQPSQRHEHLLAADLRSHWRSSGLCRSRH